MRRYIASGLLLATLGSMAHAQFTYTYFTSDSTLNSPVTTDFGIVGFSGGGFNEDDFSLQFTGPSSPTINVVDGASASDLEVFNHSTVNVSGGEIRATLHDDSKLNITGGHPGGALNIDNAVIKMQGGMVGALVGQGRSIQVSGGTVGLLIANSDTDMFGNSLGSCIVTMTGGRVTGQTSSYNAGILNLWGGQIDGDLRAAFGGTMNLYGRNFSYTLLDPNYKGYESLFSLSGTLADGSVFSDKRLIVGNGNDTGYVYLHTVPGPSAALMLLSGLVSGRLRRSRKRLAR